MARRVGPKQFHRLMRSLRLFSPRDNIFLSVIICLFLIPACTPTIKKPAIEDHKIPPALFDKTYGQLIILSQGGVAIQYKGMQIVVDPNLASEMDFSLTDYLLFTGRTPLSHMRIHVRPDIKIICPDWIKSTFMKSGLRYVKSLSDGQTLLLQKETYHAFLKGVTLSPAGLNGNLTAYFLEFDSGRTFFLDPGAISADELRDFLYGVRDDGKEIHIALHMIAEKTQNSLLDKIALLQPRLALISGDEIPIDLSLVKARLKEELFEGTVFQLRPSQVIRF